MTAFRATGFWSILASMMLLSACTTMESGAPGGTAGGSTKSVVAAGTQGDSLDACLARIPQGASSGQRMLAEASCQRDHAGRKAIDVVPGPPAK